MHMKSFLRPTLALALFLGAAAVRGEDFTFTVPVQATDLPPSVEGLTVNCRALAAPQGLDASRFRNALDEFPIIGGGSSRVGITGGAYRGDVVVRFSASQGKDPGRATAYRCTGTFDGHERGTATTYFPRGEYEPGNTRSGPPAFPLAPGAPFSLVVAQLLPH
jgi:hypothetical protein